MQFYSANIFLAFDNINQRLKGQIENLEEAIKSVSSSVGEDVMSASCSIQLGDGATIQNGTARIEMDNLKMSDELMKIIKENGGVVTKLKGKGSLYTIDIPEVGLVKVAEAIPNIKAKENLVAAAEAISKPKQKTETKTEPKPSIRFRLTQWMRGADVTPLPTTAIAEGKDRPKSTGLEKLSNMLGGGQKQQQTPEEGSHSPVMGPDHPPLQRQYNTRALPISHKFKEEKKQSQLTTSTYVMEVPGDLKSLISAITQTLTAPSSPKDNITVTFKEAKESNDNKAVYDCVVESTSKVTLNTQLTITQSVSKTRRSH